MKDPAHLLMFGSLSLFSLADVRFRTLPGIRIFFVAALLFGLLAHPWQVCVVLLVIGWENIAQAPLLMILPAVLSPAAWPIVLTAAGVRRNLVAGGDLLALAAVAWLTPWYGSWLALLGVLLWRVCLPKQRLKTVPALPGMLLGSLVAFVLGGS